MSVDMQQMPVQPQARSPPRVTELDRKELTKKIKKFSFGPARSPRYEFTMNKHRSFSRSFEKSRSNSVSDPAQVHVNPHPQLQQKNSVDKEKSKGFLASF